MVNVSKIMFLVQNLQCNAYTHITNDDTIIYFLTRDDALARWKFRFVETPEWLPY